MSRKTDIRLLSLLIPASASGVGFFCFAVLAFSFTELAAMPEAFRTAIVIGGSLALAFGSEVGTLASVVEIYHKPTRGAWDYAALVVSVLATVGAFVLSFATLLGATATWGTPVKLYGPIALGLLAALDSYGGMMELGQYLRQRRAEQRATLAADLDFELWRRQRLAQHQAALAAITGNDEAEQLRAQLREVNALLDAAEAQLAAPPTAPAATPEATPTADATPTARLLEFYATNPNASQAAAGKHIGLSRSRAGQLLRELEAAGAIRRNGHGVEVVAG